MNAPRRSQRPAYWPYLCAVIALLGDQATKVYAEVFHLLAPPIPTMADHKATSELIFAIGSAPQGLASTATGSFLSVQVTHVANAGVMLGALEESPQPIPLLAFLLATAVAFALSGWLYRIAKPSQTWLRMGALVLAAGVTGNLLDRIRLGYVVDWLYLQWRLVDWVVDAPTFNIADLLIIAGTSLAAVALMQARWATMSERTRAPGKPA